MSEMSVLVEEAEMLFVKNSLNAGKFPKMYEVPNGPSETLPDKSFTVAQILERHNRGLSLDGPSVPMWEGDEEDDFPDPRYMDLSERQEMKEFYENELKNFQHNQSLPPTPEGGTPSTPSAGLRLETPEGDSDANPPIS